MEYELQKRELGAAQMATFNQRLQEQRDRNVLGITEGAFADPAIGIEYESVECRFIWYRKAAQKACLPISSLKKILLQGSWRLELSLFRALL